MIGFLKGKIYSKSENSLTLDVNGVGYEVFLPPSALLTIGEEESELSLEIYTHFTENHLQLYGFTNCQEKEVFKKVISVSGIGPKLGQTIVSFYPFEHLISCITQGDIAALTKISGIGKKTAERLVIELKDKFKNMGFVTTKTPKTVVSESDMRQEEAVQALVSLGYSEALARKTLQKVTLTENDTVQDLIKKSLGALTQ